jgi:heterodisulfide reductase subunit C
MSIIDLTSMAEAQVTVQKEINARLTKILNEISDYCYQCAKCTAGCEAHKLLELEPHKIIALLKRGLIDEMVNSEVIWTCMSCYKCWERCPQQVAPVEILYALKNMAVARGQQIPGKFTAMLQSILGNGLIQEVQEVSTRDGKTLKRDALRLPSASHPTDNVKFQQVLTKLAVDKI